MIKINLLSERKATKAPRAKTSFRFEGTAGAQQAILTGIVLVGVIVAGWMWWSARSEVQRLEEEHRKADAELARLERLVVIESLALEAPKTRLLAARLRELGLQNVLVLVEAYDEKLDLASRNLPGVSVLPVAALDPRSLLGHDHVLATVAAVRMLEEKLS